jgi:hypothetical protein
MYKENDTMIKISDRYFFAYKLNIFEMFILNAKKGTPGGLLFFIPPIL